VAAVSDPVEDLPEPVRTALAHAFAPLRIGILLALLGAVAAIVRGLWMPGLPRAVPLVLIALALGVMIIGTVRRIRYGLHALRKP
jgi:uncharacterized membrane protein